MEPPAFPRCGLVTVRAAPGASANLAAPLPTGSPPFHYAWSRAGASLDDRFTVTDDASGVRLTVSAAQTGDSGVYTLQASNAAGSDTTRVRLEVAADEAPTGDDPPTFLRRLQDLTVKVGTRTRFLVEILSSTECKVTWYRNERRLLEAERVSLARDGNFWCADLATVSVDDAGRWTCTAENAGGRASCSAHLNVLVPKAYKRPEFVEELRALLTEQGTVSLECKVVGVPTPVLRWFKDSREIKAGDVFALTANAEDPTSLGTYTCEAVNCMGRAYSSSKVHVVGRGSREGSARPSSSCLTPEPPPIFTKELEDQFVRICEHLTLNCQLVVPPWPRSVVWYNKEGKVEPGERYHVLEDGAGGYLLEVPSAEWPDEGEWKCVATSSAGRVGISTCYVTMDVPKNYRKPRFMENLQAVLTEEGLVSFECKVVGFPTPVLSWFKDGQELKPGDVYQLTGTNSLGSYCCIARNCMGQASSSAELTVEDIQNQLNEEEKLQLFSKNQAPKFVQGLKSVEAKIDEPFRFTIKVAIPPEPSVLWYRDDQPVDESNRCHLGKEERGVFCLDIQSLEFLDQAEWKCVAMNDFGHSVTSCFLKLIIPRHYKKPRFLENLQAILSEEGAVNLECKVIGVPQPVLKWYKDGEELKPGDIHRIISGQDGTCCLGTYTCEAQNCMGIAASSASLLGFDDSMKAKKKKTEEQALQRNLSLSTIHEERTSQMYDTPVGDITTLDDKGEISFSFDGKEVSVSLYETPDLTEEEALQIVEMYADQLSENITEHNVVELPPLRFVKETSTSGNLLMEAVIIDVSPDYFVSPEEDLRTEADVEDISIADENAPPQLSLDQEIDDGGEDYLEKTMALLSEEKADIPLKLGRKKSDSQKSVDDFFSLSRDQSISEDKKDDDSQIVSESDMQSFASAHSSNKPKSKSSKLGEDGRESSEPAKTIVFNEEIQKNSDEISPQKIKSIRERRTSRGSRRSSTDSEKSLTKVKDVVPIGKDNIFVSQEIETLPATVTIKSKLSDEEFKNKINNISKYLSKVINDVQIIERDIILKSELMSSAATASRSLEIISSLISPISEIHSIADAAREAAIDSIEDSSTLLHRLPQPLKSLQQALTLIEKCITVESDSKTLVKKTCVAFIESCGTEMQDVINEIKLITSKDFLQTEDKVTSEVDYLTKEIITVIKFSADTIKTKHLLDEANEIKVEEPSLEMKHLRDTQKAVFELKTPLKSLLRIADSAESGKFVDISKVKKSDIIFNDMSQSIQDLQTALEEIESLSVKETTTSLTKYNTNIIEAVMDSVLKLRSSFEQLSVEDKCKDNTLMIQALTAIKENLNEVSSQLDKTEKTVGEYDILHSDNKLDVLQKMAQILIALENNLTRLETLPKLKSNMTTFHKNLTKVLENVIESNESKKYFVLMDICDAVKRINRSITNFDDENVLPLATLGNTLKVIQDNFIQTVFESKLNCAILSNITDTIINIQEQVNTVEERSLNVDSDHAEDFSIKRLDEAKAIAIINNIDQVIAVIENVRYMEIAEELKNVTYPALEKMTPLLEDLKRSVAAIKSTGLEDECISDLSNASYAQTLATPIYDLNENIMVLTHQIEENIASFKESSRALTTIAEPLIELQSTLQILQQEIILQHGEDLLPFEVSTRIADVVQSLQNCIVMIQEQSGIEGADELSTLDDVSGIKTTADIMPSDRLVLPIAEETVAQQVVATFDQDIQEAATAKALHTLNEHITVLRSPEVIDTLDTLSEISDYSSLKSVAVGLGELHTGIVEILHPVIMEGSNEITNLINPAKFFAIAEPMQELQQSLSVLDTTNIPIYENILELPAEIIHSVIQNVSEFKEHLNTCMLAIFPAMETADNTIEIANKVGTLREACEHLKDVIETTKVIENIALPQKVQALQSTLNSLLDATDTSKGIKIEELKSITEKLFEKVVFVQEEVIQFTSQTPEKVAQEAKLIQTIDDVANNIAILEHYDFVDLSQVSDITSISQVAPEIHTPSFMKIEDIVQNAVNVVQQSTKNTQQEDLSVVENFFKTCQNKFTILRCLITKANSHKNIIRLIQEFKSLDNLIKAFVSQRLELRLSDDINECIDTFFVYADECLKNIQSSLISIVQLQSDTLINTPVKKLEKCNDSFKEVIEYIADKKINEPLLKFMELNEVAQPAFNNIQLDVLNELQSSNLSGNLCDDVSILAKLEEFVTSLEQTKASQIDENSRNILESISTCIESHLNFKNASGTGKKLILLKFLSDCVDIIQDNILEIDVLKPNLEKVTLKVVLSEMLGPLHAMHAQLISIQEQIMTGADDDSITLNISTTESLVQTMTEKHKEIVKQIAAEQHVADEELSLMIAVDKEIHAIQDDLKNLENAQVANTMIDIAKPIHEIEKSLQSILSSEYFGVDAVHKLPKENTEEFVRHIDQYIELIEIVEEVSAIVKLENIQETFDIAKELRESIVVMESKIVPVISEEKACEIRSKQTALAHSLQKALSALNVQVLDSTQELAPTLSIEVLQRIARVAAQLQADLAAVTGVHIAIQAPSPATSETIGQIESYAAAEKSSLQTVKVSPSEKLVAETMEVISQESARLLQKEATETAEAQKASTLQDQRIDIMKTEATLISETEVPSSETSTYNKTQSINIDNSAKDLESSQNKQGTEILSDVMSVRPESSDIVKVDQTALISKILSIDKEHEDQLSAERETQDTPKLSHLDKLLQDVEEFTSQDLSEAVRTLSAALDVTELQKSLDVAKEFHQNVASSLSEIQEETSITDVFKTQLVTQQLTLAQQLQMALASIETMALDSTQELSSVNTEILAHVTEVAEHLRADLVAAIIDHTLQESPQLRATEAPEGTVTTSDQAVTEVSTIMAKETEQIFVDAHTKDLEINKDFEESDLKMDEVQDLKLVEDSAPHGAKLDLGQLVQHIEVFLSPEISEVVHEMSVLTDAPDGTDTLNIANDLKDIILNQEVVSIASLNAESQNVQGNLIQKLQDALSVLHIKTLDNSERLAPTIKFETLQKTSEIITQLQEDLETASITEIAGIKTPQTWESPDNSEDSLQKLKDLLQVITTEINISAANETDDTETLKDSLDEVQTVIIKLKQDYDGVNDTLNETLEDLECSVRSVQLQINEDSPPELLQEACATLQLLVDNMSDIQEMNITDSLKPIQHIDTILGQCSNETDETVKLLEIASKIDDSTLSNIIRCLNDLTNDIKALRLNFLDSAEILIDQGIDVLQNLNQLEDKVFMLEKDLTGATIATESRDSILTAIHSVYGSISNMRSAVCSIQKRYMFENYGKPSELLLNSIKIVKNISTVDINNTTKWKLLSKSLRKVLNHFEDIKFYINLDKTARLPSDASFTKIILKELQSRIQDFILPLATILGAEAEETVKATVYILNEILTNTESKTTLDVKDKIPIFKKIVEKLSVSINIIDKELSTNETPRNKTEQRSEDLDTRLLKEFITEQIVSQDLLELSDLNAHFSKEEHLQNKDEKILETIVKFSEESDLETLKVSQMSLPEVLDISEIRKVANDVIDDITAKAVDRLENISFPLKSEDIQETITDGNNERQNPVVEADLQRPSTSRDFSDRTSEENSEADTKGIESPVKEIQDKDDIKYESENIEISQKEILKLEGTVQEQPEVKMKLQEHQQASKSSDERNLPEIESLKAKSEEQQNEPEGKVKIEHDEQETKATKDPHAQKAQNKQDGLETNQEDRGTKSQKEQEAKGKHEQEHLEATTKIEVETEIEYKTEQETIAAKDQKEPDAETTNEHEEILKTQKEQEEVEANTEIKQGRLESKAKKEQQDQQLKATKEQDEQEANEKDKQEVNAENKQVELEAIYTEQEQQEANSNKEQVENAQKAQEILVTKEKGTQDTTVKHEQETDAEEKQEMLAEPQKEQDVSAANAKKEQAMREGKKQKAKSIEQEQQNAKAKNEQEKQEFTTPEEQDEQEANAQKDREKQAKSQKDQDELAGKAMEEQVEWEDGANKKQEKQVLKDKKEQEAIAPIEPEKQAKNQSKQDELAKVQEERVTQTTKEQKEQQPKAKKEQEAEAQKEQDEQEAKAQKEQVEQESKDKKEQEEQEAKAQAQKEQEELEAKAKKEKEELEAKAKKEQEEQEAKYKKEQKELEAKAKKEKEEQEAKAKKEQKEQEAKAKKEQEEQEAKAQKEQEEQEAKAQKEKEELEAKAKKEQEEQEAKAKKEKEELEAKAKKEKEELEAKAKKEQEEQEAKAKKEKEELEAKAKKEQLEHEAKAQEEMKGQAQKEQEELEAKAKKEKEEQEANAKKEQEEQEAKAKKEKEEQKAKAKEEKKAQAQKEQEELEAKAKKEKEEQEAKAKKEQEEQEAKAKEEQDEQEAKAQEEKKAQARKEQEELEAKAKKEKEEQEAKAKKEQEEQEAKAQEEKKAQAQKEQEELEAKAKKEKEEQKAKAKKEKEEQEAKAKKEKEELEAKAKKEQEEQEAKAKKEQEEQEAKAQKEQEEQEAKAQEEKKAQAQKEQEELEAKAKKEKEEQEANAKKEQEEQEAKAQEEKKAQAQKEQEELEAKAKKEKEELAAKAKKEQEEQETKAKQEQEEQEAKAQKEQEEQKAKAKKEQEELEAKAKKEKEEQEAKAKKEHKEQEAKAQEEKKAQALKEQEALEAKAKKEKEELAAKAKEEKKAQSQKEQEDLEAKAKKEKEELDAKAKKEKKAQSQKEQEDLEAKAKKEKEELAAKAKKEHKEQEAKAQEEKKAQALKEQEALEAKAKKEKEELAAKAKEEKKAQSQKEQEDLEAKAKKEKEELEAKAKKEQEEQEAKAKKEKEELEAKAKKEQLEQEAKAQEEKKGQAQKEQEELEAKAKKEKEEQEANAKKEQEEQEAKAKKEKEEQKAKAKEEKKAQAKKEQEDLEAKAKKKQEEQEATAKKEQEEQEAKAKEEQDEQEAKAQEEKKAQARKEQEELEAKAKKEKEEQEAKAKKEQEEQEAKAQEEKKAQAQKEQEELEAKAKKEKEEQKAKAKKEKEEQEAKAKKEKEELEAKAKKEQEEQEAKAKKEQEEQEAKAQKEQEEQEAKAQEEKKAQAQKEQEELEAKAKKEKEEQEANAKKEQEEQEAKAQEEKKAQAQKEQEELEAKAKKEKEELAAKAKKEQEEQETKAKQEQEEQEAKAQKEQEEQKAKAKKEQEELEAKAKKEKEEQEAKAKKEHKEQEAKAQEEKKAQALKEQEALEAKAKKEKEELAAKAKEEKKAQSQKEQEDLEAKAKKEKEELDAKAKKEKKAQSQKEQEDLEAKAKKEKEELAAKAKKEHKEQEAKAQEEKKAQALKEQEALEAKAKKEKEELAAKAKEEKKAQSQKEQEDLEAKAKKEKEELEAKAKKEQEEQEAKAKKEKEELEAKAKKEQLEQEAKAQEEKKGQAQKEQEELEAKAKKEKEEQEANAKKEQEEQEAKAKKEKEEQKAKAKEEKKAQAKKEQEDLEAKAKKKQEEQEATAKKEQEEQEAKAKEEQDEQEAKAQEEKKAQARKEQEELEAKAKKEKEEQEAKAKKEQEEQEAKAQKEQEEQEAKAQEEKKAHAQKEQEELEAKAKKEQEAKAKKEQDEQQAKAEKKQETQAQQQKKELEAKAKQDQDEQEAKAKKEIKSQAQKEEKEFEAKAKEEHEERKAAAEKEQEEQEAKAHKEQEAQAQKKKKELEAKDKQDQEKREAEAQKQREELESKAKKTKDAPVQKEHEVLEAKAKKEQEEQQAKIEKEQEAQSQKEKKELEAKAKKEQEKQEAKAKREQKAQKEKKELESKAKQDQESREADAKKEQEEQKATASNEQKELEAKAKKEQDKQEAKAKKEQKAQSQKEKKELEAKAKQNQEEAKKDKKAQPQKKQKELEAIIEKEQEEQAKSKIEQELASTATQQKELETKVIKDEEEEVKANKEQKEQEPKAKKELDELATKVKKQKELEAKAKKLQEDQEAKAKKEQEELEAKAKKEQDELATKAKKEQDELAAKAKKEQGDAKANKDQKDKTQKEHVVQDAKPKKQQEELGAITIKEQEARAKEEKKEREQRENEAKTKLEAMKRQEELKAKAEKEQEKLEAKAKKELGAKAEEVQEEREDKSVKGQQDKAKEEQEELVKVQKEQEELAVKAKEEQKQQEVKAKQEQKAKIKKQQAKLEGNAKENQDVIEAIKKEDVENKEEQDKGQKEKEELEAKGKKEQLTKTETRQEKREAKSKKKQEAKATIEQEPMAKNEQVEQEPESKKYLEELEINGAKQQEAFEIKTKKEKNEQGLLSATKKIQDKHMTEFSKVGNEEEQETLTKRERKYKVEENQQQKERKAGIKEQQPESKANIQQVYQEDNYDVSNNEKINRSNKMATEENQNYIKHHHFEIKNADTAEPEMSSITTSNTLLFNKSQSGNGIVENEGLEEYQHASRKPVKELNALKDYNNRDYTTEFLRPPNYRERTFDADRPSESLSLGKNVTIYKAQTILLDSQLRSSVPPSYENNELERRDRPRSKALSETRNIILDKRSGLSRDSKRKPVFSTYLTDRTAVEGSRVKLTCSVLSSTDPQITWYKNGIILDNKLKYRIKTMDGLITFEVLNAVPSDSAEYSCTVQNENGSVSTSANLKVYPSFEASPIPPTFTRSIRDTYHLSENELVLECRIRGQPLPTITWLKDDKPVNTNDRYQAYYLADGVCRLAISCPTPEDSGKYACKAENSMWSDHITHVVNFTGRESRLSPNLATIERSRFNRQAMESRRPHFTNVLTDYKVVHGGTIGLQVEIRGSPTRVEWLREGRSVTEVYRNARTFVEQGLYTLALSDVTENDSGRYTCRAWSTHGNVDMDAAITVVQPNEMEGKPAIIVGRPEKDILISVGEDINISFRVQGEPKPKVIFMKGIRDVTNNQRVCKMTSDDYVKFTLKRSVVSDAGTYCVLARNAYGCDRAFITVVVRQRASSDNLISDWTYPADDSALTVAERQYKSVPERIPGEPSIAEGGSNWVSLAWPKPDNQIAAPVLAYKVESWLLGKEGGARWVELGITPLNSFDAFNLKQGEEYHFRVTPRNRYGWGESVQTTTPVGIGLAGDRPEFVDILPGQLKVLAGETANLSCSVKGKPLPEVVWMKNGHEIEEATRMTTLFNGRDCCLIIKDINSEDDGRYSCEATNVHGRASTYARLAVVTDRCIWEADAKLKRERSADVEGEYPPQFTMRLRDRRVQATYPVRLTCQVVGSPAPSVTWFKDGEEVTFDNRRTKYQDEHFHTLEIAPTTLEDGGVYEAMARNSCGAVSCRCGLVVDKGIRAYVAPEFCCGLEPLYRLAEGDELRISAVVEAYPSVGVTWYRDGVRLRPSRRAIMTLDRDGQIELALAAVTPRDAGVYTCTASNEVGRASTSGKVDVIGDQQTREKRTPPVVINAPDVPYSKEPMFILKPRSSEAREGDTVIIACEVIGDPKPDVYWLRDFLKPDYYRDASHFKRVGDGPGYRFEIPHAKLDYTGAYSVVAKNVHGEAKAIISLQILAKDLSCSDDAHNVRYGRVEVIPRFDRNLTDLLSYDGDAIEFECRVTGNPEPDIRWFHYHELIRDSEDFESTFDDGTARLKIKQVTAEDEGTYTCEASNNLGKATSSACLVVYPPGEPNTLSQRLRRPPALLSAASTPRSTPRSTPARSVSRTPGPDTRRLCSPSRQMAPSFYTYPFNKVVEEGESVTLKCAVKGLPAPWATWDKDGVIVTPSARVTIKEKDEMLRILEIEQVTIEDVGIYRITLENEYGRAEASARLEVITQKGKFYGGLRAYSPSPRRCMSYRRRTPSASRQD